MRRSTRSCDDERDGDPEQEPGGEGAPVDRDDRRRERDGRRRGEQAQRTVAEARRDCGDGSDQAIADSPSSVFTSA
jgi:hypothetical protein